MQLLHVVTDDARKSSAQRRAELMRWPRARVYPLVIMCFLLSHLSHPLKYRGIWGESKGKIAVINLILLSHGEKWEKKRLYSIKIGIIPH